MADCRIGDPEIIIWHPNCSELINGLIGAKQGVTNTAQHALSMFRVAQTTSDCPNLNQNMKSFGMQRNVKIHRKHLWFFCRLPNDSGSAENIIWLRMRR
jgi:hypothetical protein